jgi:hypothetical protein
MSGPVRRFTLHHEVYPDLRANGAGWMLRGRFSIRVRFEPAPDVSRYEYRQYIRGTAWTQAGQFPEDETPSVENWTPSAPRVNAAALFEIAGGLPTSWTEDGQGSECFGHRDAAGVSRAGLVDRYSPDQANGDSYELVDTYGFEGTNRVFGTKLFFDLRYRFVIVDRQEGGSREILRRSLRTSAERILT